jgi:hypothetical protein
VDLGDFNKDPNFNVMIKLLLESSQTDSNIQTLHQFIELAPKLINSAKSLPCEKECQ